VADYFLSDVHLRLDHPERSERLARVVSRLEANDALYVIGDLCDFWFASRQTKRYSNQCHGLRALTDFSDGGGRLVLLGGNHDLWLGDFYEKHLGATWISDELRFESHKLRVRLKHGHTFGGQSAWKSAMESRGFLRAFSMLPEPIAYSLERGLVKKNAVHKLEDDQKKLEAFRLETQKMSGTADVVILGHAHMQVDESVGSLRMLILNSWFDRANYLRIGSSGPEFFSPSDAELGIANPITSPSASH
jgi:UDP-2,3-diacylglucosamine hydrolase